MVKRLIACLLTLTLVFTSVNLYEVQAKKIKLNKYEKQTFRDLLVLLPMIMAILKRVFISLI